MNSRLSGNLEKLSESRRERERERNEEPQGRRDEGGDGGAETERKTERIFSTWELPASHHRWHNNFLIFIFISTACIFTINFPAESLYWKV